MPTLLGPTNMPLLEAACLDCPVICSDLEGHREMLGDYALYFNPYSPEDISFTLGSFLSTKAKNYLNKKSLIIHTFFSPECIFSIHEAFAKR